MTEKSSDQLRTYLHELADTIADRATWWDLRLENDLVQFENRTTGTMEHQATGHRCFTIRWKEAHEPTMPEERVRNPYDAAAVRFDWRRRHKGPRRAHAIAEFD